MHAESSTAEATGARGLPEAAAFTADRMRALAARLVGESLIVFPVRHHSPACAWQLRRLLARVRPATVLVEGPREFDRLIPQLVHPQARMPLAIYSYAVLKGEGADDGRRHAAYYPFCDHSPELVALRHAAAHGIPARFIDLDFAIQCRIEVDAPEPDSRSLLDERHLHRSRALSALAARLQCRDHEALWEHLFEVPAVARSLEDHVATITAYCELARMECSERDLADDGTLAREAEMASHVRDAIAARQPGDGPVLAVVGGFHALALLDAIDAIDAGPASARPVAPRLTHEGTALIRYGQQRLDRLNGYAAGMTSPAWHQQVWDRLLKHDQARIDTGAPVRHSVALAMLSSIADELRERHQVLLPMPALGGAYEHALRLARLRRREAPAREDVLDAVTSCFVKGDVDGEGALVLAVARRLLSGDRIGTVPPGTDRPPLVVDFQRQALRQRLKIDDGQPHHTVLDLYRRDEHRRTSRLLHGLAMLGVPFGVRTAGPDFVRGTGLERLREQWDYTYGPATEAALVEASVHGTTVALAVGRRFQDRIAAMIDDGSLRQANTAAAMLTQACVLGLHDWVTRMTGTLAAAIAEDASFESVAGAAGTLGLLAEAREPLEAGALEALPRLIGAAYERAVALGGDLPAAKDDGRAHIEALSRLRELLASEAGRPLDASLFWGVLQAVSTGHPQAAVRGAAIGLRHGAGRIDEAALATAVQGHLDGMLPAPEAVAFLRGLLQTAREIAWQQPGLLSVLDGMLGRWSEDAFITALPELRLAFAAMTPSETDRIAEAVAGLHGEATIDARVREDIDAEEMQRRLSSSQAILAQWRAEGLGGWLR